MGHVIWEHSGPPGSGKTRTALTARGRIAIIDRDNQAWIYRKAIGRATFQPNWALMVKDHGPLAAGDPAIWVTADPTESGRTNVKSFVEAAGLGPGDTLVDDPWSNLWAACVEAGDIKFGRKGMKIDWSALKAPVKSLLSLYRNLPCDVCLITRQKEEWKDGAPTGVVKSAGEGSQTPYEVPFGFRFEVDEQGRNTAVVTRQKGGLFTVGERFVLPDMGKIMAERGVYELAASEPPTPDTTDRADAIAEALMEPENPVERQFTDFVARMREAARAGTLTAFREDKVNRATVGGFPKDKVAEIKRLAEELAK